MVASVAQVTPGKLTQKHVKPVKRTSKALSQVHVTHEGIATLEMTPPHDPREDTPAYREAHHLLVVTLNKPCIVCGVTRRTLGNPKRNPFGAEAMETHHSPVERSLLHAVDWRKVHKRFPSVYSQASLEAWVDTPENLLVACDVHHRSVKYGIHHLGVADWSVLPFLRDGYIVAATQKDMQAALAADTAIMQAAGMMPPTMPSTPATPATA